MAKCIAPNDGLSSLRNYCAGRRSRAYSWGLVITALLVTACQRDNAGNGAIDAFGAISGRTADTVAADRLVTAVNNAHVTDRIATSMREHKEADAGNTFVVLDVTVRNTGTQPQVFSEGTLVDVNASRERTFATPVSMLADEFLTLQVVPPDGRVRGKIAYEVPKEITGVMYWSPGNGSRRILLTLVPTVAVSTLANAATPAEPVTSSDIDIGADTVAKTTPPIATPARTRTPATLDAPARVVAPPAEKLKDQPRHVAMVTTPKPDVGPSVSETARALACQALLSRNDPAEKSRYLGFFARECPDFAMPSAWKPAPGAAAARVASTVPSRPSATPPAKRWPPRAGPAFDCSQAWTRAEHLVCEDAVLSLMDWELARAYAHARRYVDNKDALQRDEDNWRHHIRDACDTRRCVEVAYSSRTEQLELIAKARLVRDVLRIHEM